MIIVYCEHCFTAVRVMGEEDEISSLVGPRSDFWPDGFECVTCESKCHGALETEVEPSLLGRMKLLEITAQELFSCQMGLGLPDERGCDFETVRSLFLNKRVTQIKGSSVRNTTRSVIDSIFFEDGSRLYLGAGPQGALVYRIAKPLVEMEQR